MRRVGIQKKNTKLLRRGSVSGGIHTEPMRQSKVVSQKNFHCKHFLREEQWMQRFENGKFFRYGQCDTEVLGYLGR